MRKRMDKKAIALRSVLLLLLGLAAVAIVVVGVMGGFDAIFSKIGLLPGNLEVAAQSCGISASQDLKTSYCYEFKYVAIGGTKQHITCDELEAYADFEKLTGECEESKVDLAAIALCGTLKDTRLVNGKVCYSTTVDSWGVSKDNP